MAFVAGGFAAALLGVLAGLPRWRIKGFYLVVCTLAVQFFIEWAFTAFRWFSKDNSSGQVEVPSLRIAGHDFNSPVGHYLLALGVVAVLTWVARNIVESELGRRFLAVRDMDTAAAVIGIPVLRTKLLAFGISSFYCGVAGALWGFVNLGSFDPRTWELGRSFQVLFIIIIGGMGSIAGSFVGAAFMLLLPILMSHLASAWLRGAVDQGTLSNYQKIVFGILIIFFPIKERGAGPGRGTADATGEGDAQTAVRPLVRPDHQQLGRDDAIEAGPIVVVEGVVQLAGDRRQRSDPRFRRRGAMPDARAPRGSARVDRRPHSRAAHSPPTSQSSSGSPTSCLPSQSVLAEPHVLSGVQCCCSAAPAAAPRPARIQGREPDALARSLLLREGSHTQSTEEPSR